MRIVRAVLRPFQSFWGNPIFREFRRAPSGIAGMTIVAMFVAIAIFAPMFLSDRADRQDFSHPSESPSWQFPLGTDSLGRDTFVRLLVATRLSLGLALAAAMIALVLGLTFGGSTALQGRRLRSGMQRVIDTFISFPALLKVIVITVILGRGTWATVLGVGIAFSFGYARLTSTLANSVGGREYINSARVVGVKKPRLLARYVLPNIAEPLTVAFSLAVAGAILTVSALSFLGLGVQPPQYDWGQMLSQGLQAIYESPAQALGPAAFIVLASIGFGLMGEALARAMNPLLWTRPKKSGRGAATQSDEPGAAAPQHLPQPPPAPEYLEPTGPEQFSSASVAIGQVVHPPTPGAVTPTAPVLAASVSSGDRTRDAATAEAPEPGQNGIALRVDDLVVSFPTAAGTVEVVKGVSFTVADGEVLGIVGESGSGKTMTALAIAQLTPLQAEIGGRITLHGQDLSSLPKKRLDEVLGAGLGFVFQDPMSSLNPAIKIGPQLTEAIRVHKHIPREEAKRLAIDRLTELHIPAADRQINRYPHEFSGGMRQRAMIAKGLIKEPTLLIADEPTTALDVTVQAQILDLLHEINETHGTSVVLISHNLAVVSQNCDRVIVMYAGRIVEDLDTSQLITNPLHPYTRALLNAVPQLGQPRDQRLESIPGEIPDIGSPPPGCAFHPRCPLAIDRCRTERPQLLARPDERNRRVACHVANEAVDQVAATAAGRVDD